MPQSIQKFATKNDKEEPINYVAPGNAKITIMLISEA